MQCANPPRKHEKCGEFEIGYEKSGNLEKVKEELGKLQFVCCV